MEFSTPAPVSNLVNFPLRGCWKLRYVSERKTYLKKARRRRERIGGENVENKESSREQLPARGMRVRIEVDSSDLDKAIEKANRLAELLREAAAIISSLSGRIN